MSNPQGSSFSAELQKYCARRGNKIIFRNGMTLNQLAWEMWERLGYKEVDPSVLSRVLSGDRLFSIKQLETFCKTIKLQDQEYESLKKRLLNEVLQKLGLDLSFLEVPNLNYIDLLYDNIFKIEQIRARDLPLLALEWVNFIEPKVKDVLINTKNAAKRRNLMDLECKLLIQKAHCYTEVSSPNEAKITLLPITSRISDIGEELGNIKIKILGNFFRGCGLYINGDYGKCIKLLLDEVENPFSSFYRYLALRALAISYANLGEAGLYIKTKIELLKMFDMSNLSEKCSILEGLGRAEGILGNFDEFNKNIDFAWTLNTKEFYEGSEFFLLKKIQIIRSDLEVHARIKSNSEKSYLEKIGTEGIGLSQAYGFRKYEVHMKRFLDRLLN